VSVPDTMSASTASRERTRSASAPAIRRTRDMRSASTPAGMDMMRNGSVCAACRMPAAASPAPITSTATIGAAASASCSADCAARLDQTNRWNAAGRRVLMARPSLQACVGGRAIARPIRGRAPIQWSRWHGPRRTAGRFAAVASGKVQASGLAIFSLLKGSSAIEVDPPALRRTPPLAFEFARAWRCRRLDLRLRVQVRFDSARRDAVAAESL
jgi:hypothetical protein